MLRTVLGTIAFSIGLAAVLALRPGSSTQVQEQQSLETWEYLQNWEAFDKRKGRNGAVLDSLGSQGWELVHIVTETGPMGSGFWHGIFKRRVSR